jgi:hypothetical protein
MVNTTAAETHAAAISRRKVRVDVRVVLIRKILKVL